MKLRRLKLANYRAYPQLDVTLEDGVNVIVGENNVGKSLFFEAIGWAQSLPINQQLLLPFWPNGKPENPLSVLIELELADNEVDLIGQAVPQPAMVTRNIAFEASAVSPRHVTELKMYFLEKDVRRFTFGFDQNLSGYSSTNLGATLGVQSISTLRALLQQGIFHFPEFRYRPTSGEIGENESLRTTEGSKLAAVLLKLSTSPTKTERRLYEEIRIAFNRLFDDLELVAVKRANQPTIMIGRKGSDYEISLSEVGAGIFEILLVLTHITRESNRVFLMDEPETHLHPHAQRLLESELRNISQKNQLLLTTHSPHFVSFQNIENVVLVRRSSGQSKATKLPKGYLIRDEEAKATRIIWSEEKEFLFSRRVLLVEGPTEFGAIPIFAKKLGKDFDESGLSIIPAGGKHFGLSIKILRGFGIPYRIACDLDALAEIGGNVTFDGKKIRSSPLFEGVQKGGLLEGSEMQILSDVESKIVKLKNKKGKEVESYDDETCTKLMPLARKFGFYVLTPDFEGVIAKSADESFLKEAERLYPNNKVLKGRYLAEKIENIPDQLQELIKDVITIS